MASTFSKMIVAMGFRVDDRKLAALSAKIGGVVARANVASKSLV